MLWLQKFATRIIFGTKFSPLPNTGEVIGRHGCIHLHTEESRALRTGVSVDTQDPGMKCA